MTSATVTEISSLGSPYGIPSVPNATPATEPLEFSIVDPPPPMDFAAVTQILGPQTEYLNDKAEEAMYPSPPINTPILGSPTPSVKLPLYGRGRGFSVIGDRLAQLKLDNHKHRHHHLTTDITSSNHSVEPSIAEDCDECELASTSEVMSDQCKDKSCPGHVSMSMSPPLLSPMNAGSIPVALGSPAVNPRIEEYLSFTSKDLPAQAPPPATGTTLAEHASSTNTIALDGHSRHSHVSFKSDGVTEKSNWAEELEDSVDRTCLRLEQLAKDEHATNPSKSVDDYYVARLRRLLTNKKRQIPVNITKAAERK
ncbi:hypothetical protein GQ44DRAFT_77778 [Phaeosphaeriaceae sp. PMI808]|nr:hypothetical protein GQ44DRAFT_77778 [Phaeosphaeriaceae sp. PMI808]